MSRPRPDTPRVGFVMEQTLGSVTYYRNLRTALDAQPASGVEPAWYELPYAQGRAPWALRGSAGARRLAARAVDQGAQALVVHTTTVSLFMAGYARRMPVVISTDATAANKDGMRADYELPARGGLTERAKAWAYRRAFAPAAGFLVWCDWAGRSLVRDYGVDPARVQVIPPGVDLDGLRPAPDREAAAEAGRPVRLLFVGGDFARKGGDLLLDVFRSRLRGRAELDLVTRADLAEEPGVRVHRGLQPNDPRLLDLYARADLFVFPTRSDCFPVAPLEAMAAGLPVVATRVGGIPDQVASGETGWLVQPDDGLELAAALERLVAEPRLRRRMSLAARARVEAQFDQRVLARRTAEAVRRMVLGWQPQTRPVPRTLTVPQGVA